MILIKSQKEIEGIRKSGQLAADALKYAGTLVKAGTTTQEINNLTATFVSNRGGFCACLGYKGFPKEICTSINDVVCHGIPSSYKLRDGDIIKIDVTTILNGFYGDNAATFEVGQVSKKAKALIAVTKKCLEIGLAQVIPGKNIGVIGHEISKFAMTEGYTVVYEFAGHGCGLYFHEDPSILHISSPTDGPVIQEGMTFTIEPMICQGVPKIKIDRDGWTARTADGMLSAQFEHTIAVTNDGYDILTLPSENYVLD